jgi:hypothetical protein
MCVCVCVMGGEVACIATAVAMGFCSTVCEEGGGTQGWYLDQQTLDLLWMRCCWCALQDCQGERLPSCPGGWGVCVWGGGAKV